MTSRACMNCQHWEGFFGPKHDEEDPAGLCRAKPPVADTRDRTAVWPITKMLDWCACISMMNAPEEQPAPVDDIAF